MFSIIPNPTFTTTVRLAKPGDPVGEPLTITWRHKGARALEVWRASAVDRATDADFLGEVIADWQGMAGPAGAAVPYTAEALAQVLDAFPGLSRQLMQCYMRELTDARAKN